MGAFIIAGIIVVITILITALRIFAAMMSDTTGNDLNPVPGLLGGLALAALVAATHWLPHIGW